MLCIPTSENFYTHGLASESQSNRLVGQQSIAAHNTSPSEKKKSPACCLIIGCYCETRAKVGKQATTCRMNSLRVVYGVSTILSNAHAGLLHVAVVAQI